MNEKELAALIGKNIRVFRKLNNMTLDQLSDKVGVNRMSLSKYERGSQMISAVKLFVIAEALNVPIEKLYKNNGTI